MVYSLRQKGKLYFLRKISETFDKRKNQRAKGVRRHPLENQKRHDDDASLQIGKDKWKSSSSTKTDWSRKAEEKRDREWERERENCCKGGEIGRTGRRWGFEVASRTVDIDQGNVVRTDVLSSCGGVDGCEITAAGTLVDTPWCITRSLQLVARLLTTRNGFAGLPPERKREVVPSACSASTPSFLFFLFFIGRPRSELIPPRVDFNLNRSSLSVRCIRGVINTNINVEFTRERYIEDFLRRGSFE